jgi:transposase
MMKKKMQEKEQKKNRKRTEKEQKKNRKRTEKEQKKNRKSNINSKNYIQLIQHANRPVELSSSPLHHKEVI